MMGNYFGHMGGFGPIFGFGGGLIFMMFFGVIIIWAIFAWIRGLSGYGFKCGHRHWEEKEKENKALDILKERYAKGEITREDFEEMKKDIE